MKHNRQIPTFPLPPSVRQDEFGIPFPYALETEERKKAREAAVNALIAKVFAKACAHLGEQCARVAFAAHSKRSPGKPCGSTKPERDAELLRMYFERLKIVGKAQRQAVPRIIAAEVSKTWRGRFGASREAVEKKLRRMITGTSLARHKERHQMRLLRFAHTKQFARKLTSLLSAARSEQADSKGDEN